jgi:hypothetical protein
MRELVCLELVVLILYILTYLCILLSFNVHEEVSMWYELKHPRSSCCLPHLSPTTLTSCGRAPTFSFPSSSLISRAQHFKRLCRECLRAVILYLSFGWSRLQQNRPKILVSSAQLLATAAEWMWLKMYYFQEQLPGTNDMICRLYAV